MSRKSEAIPYKQLRPREIDKVSWTAIIEAWENGLSDREASLRASRDSGVLITEAQLKRIIAENEQVASLKEYLSVDIISKAKLNIAEAIRNGDKATSKWYLERKASNEFSSKASVAFEGAVATLSMEDKRKQMEEFMNQFEIEDEPLIVDEGDSDGE